jgi:hypothetical protein
MSEAQQRRIELLGKDVEYAVRHSSDASEERIDVDIHGVQVVIPDGQDTSPVKLLRENAAWVVEKTQKFRQYREQAPERQFEEGEKFPYLGEPHEVVVEQRPSSSVVDGQFLLAEHHVEQTSIRRALETTYRREARKRFERRADHFAAEMDVEYDEIEIRNQRTRWGSCSTTGTIGLNWRLMMASSDVIDYIIVHELAHIQESNHSDAFWGIVDEQLPNYQQNIQWLDQNSTKLTFSEDDI